MRYRFDACLLDTDTGELIRDGSPVALRRQAFRLLQVLVERAPALVSRDELLDSVWGHDALSPNVLPQTVSELRQALGDSAQSPRYIETRHRRGYRLIAPAQAVAVAEASAMAGERAAAASAPSGAVTAAPRSAPQIDAPQAARRVRSVARAVPGRWLSVLGAALLIASVVLIARFRFDTSAVRRADAVVQVLALDRFPAGEGVPGWVPAAGVELLTQSLQDIRGLRLARGEAFGLRQAVTDARWQHSMNELLGAPVALAGHWRQDGAALVLDLSLIDLGSGRVLRAARHAGEPDALDALIAAARDDVLRALDLPGFATPPSSPAPAQRQRWWDALAHLSRGEADAAAQALLALERDAPDADWLRPALIQALRETGRGEEARTRIAAYLAHARDLPLGRRLRMQAEQAAVLHQPEQAAAALRALVELEPDDPELRLQLADRELDALQGEAARDTLATLTREARQRNDPRVLLLSARLARLDGDLQTALDAADAAARIAQRHGLTAAAAAAALDRAATLRVRGDLNGALDAIAVTQQAWQDRLPEPYGVALESERIALLREQGRHADARAAFDSALAAAGARGASAEALARLRIEGALTEALDGRPDPAIALLETTRGSPLADPSLSVAWHNARAIALLGRGEVDAAREAFDTAFAQARRDGLAGHYVALQVNADLRLARQRRFVEAESMWQQALETFERLGDKRGQATCLGNLAAAASSVGHNERAAELNQRALGLFRELRLPGPRARTAYNLGLQSMRAGRLPEADALLAEAVDVWRSEVRDDQALQAAASLAELRQLGGDAAGARAALDAVEDMVAASSPLKRSHFHAARAELELAAGRVETARSLHAQARTLREEAGAQAWEALSELNLLRIDLRAGVPPLSIAVRAEALAERFGSMREPRDRARALVLVARARLGLHQRDRAAAALTAATTALAGFEDQPTSWTIQWLGAWSASPEERQMHLRVLRDRAVSMKFGRYVQWVDAALHDDAVLEARSPPE